MIVTPAWEVTCEKLAEAQIAESNERKQPTQPEFCSF
jgi:hypothetical protein